MSGSALLERTVPGVGEAAWQTLQLMPDAGGTHDNVSSCDTSVIPAIHQCAVRASPS